jgi:hypothetical protein
VVGGERYRVEGTVQQIEALVVDAARGSLLQLVWLTEAPSGDRFALNPEHVIALRPYSNAR